MAFAIDEINNNSNLLPNVTLGYSLYDNCAALVIGFSAALSLASGREEQFLLKENCLGAPPVLGIVGDSYSTFSIATSNVLGLYRMPIVSHFATCTCLSDRQQFPSFFRTIPSDAFQVRAMIQILKHFGWTWVGLLVSDDDYGLHVARSFQSDLAQSGGGCLAYLEVLPWDSESSELRKIVHLIKTSTSRVVIVFAHEVHMIHLMEEVVKQNVTGQQWIASEAWTAVSVLQTPRFMPYLSGTLGIAIRRGEIPGLREFLLQIRPDQNDSNYENKMVKQFWEYTFQCKFDPAAEAGGAPCTGQEDLENVETEILDLSNLRPEYNIYKAVYALAYALDGMLRCVPGRGPFSGHSCATLQTMEPWQLVHYLQKVNFTTAFGDEVSFDENGDALPIYDIMNWLWLPDGRTKVQNVGEVKRLAFKGEVLTINEDKIFWNFEFKEVISATFRHLYILQPGRTEKPPPPKPAHQSNGYSRPPWSGQNQKPKFKGNPRFPNYRSDKFSPNNQENRPTRDRKESDRCKVQDTYLQDKQPLKQDPSKEETKKDNDSRKKGVAHKFYLSMTLEDELVHEALLDTAADITLMSATLFNTLRAIARRSNKELKLQACSLEVQPYGPHSTTLKVMALVQLTIRPMTLVHPVYVPCLDAIPPLVGKDLLNWFEPLIDFKQLNIWAQVHQPISLPQHGWTQCCVLDTKSVSLKTQVDPPEVTKEGDTPSTTAETLGCVGSDILV
ncbi:hypothetical protein ABVT39_004798 [Epinephelus coioides]